MPKKAIYERWLFFLLIAKIMRNLILFQTLLIHGEPSQDLIFGDLRLDRETVHHCGLMGVKCDITYLN